MYGNLCPRAFRRGPRKAKFPFVHLPLGYCFKSYSFFSARQLFKSRSRMRFLLWEQFTKPYKDRRKNIFYLNSTIHLPSVIWLCNASTQKRKTGRGPRFASELGTTEHGRRWTKRKRMKWKMRTKSH